MPPFWWDLQGLSLLRERNICVACAKSFLFIHVLPRGNEKTLTWTGPFIIATQTSHSKISMICTHLNHEVRFASSRLHLNMLFMRAWWALFTNRDSNWSSKQSSDAEIRNPTRLINWSLDLRRSSKSSSFALDEFSVAVAIAGELRW